MPHPTLDPLLLDFTAADADPLTRGFITVRGGPGFSEAQARWRAARA